MSANSSIDERRLEALHQDRKSSTQRSIVRLMPWCSWAHPESWMNMTRQVNMSVILCAGSKRLNVAKSSLRSLQPHRRKALCPIDNLSKPLMVPTDSGKTFRILCDSLKSFSLSQELMAPCCSICVRASDELLIKWIYDLMMRTSWTSRGGHMHNQCTRMIQWGMCAHGGTDKTANRLWSRCSSRRSVRLKNSAYSAELEPRLFKACKRKSWVGKTNDIRGKRFWQKRAYQRATHRYSYATKIIWWDCSGVR